MVVDEQSLQLVRNYHIIIIIIKENGYRSDIENDVPNSKHNNANDSINERDS